MTTTRLKPAVLSSKIARQNLAGHPEMARPVFETIDRLSRLYNSLEGMRASPDPTKTPAANALAYADAYAKASKEAERLAHQTVDGLRKTREGVISAGRKAAGLDQKSEFASEIRAALRGMTQADRDRAISDAIKNGDGRVLSSIIDVPEVLRGQVSLPLNQLIDLAVATASPETGKTLQAIDSAHQHAKFAYDAFSKSADSGRDKGLERAGEAGAAKAAKAADAMKAALAPSAPMAEAGIA